MDQGPSLSTSPDEPGEIQSRLVVLEKNHLIDAALLACLPLGLLLFGAFLLLGFSPGAFGIHVAFVASVVRFGMARENARPRPVLRDIRISAEGVRIDDELLPRAKIAEGWYQPRAGGSTVRLFDRQKRVIFEARVESEDEAQRMLRALGLDVSQKRAEFRTVSPFTANQERSIVGFSALAMAGVMLSRLFLHLGPVPFFAAIGLFGVLALIPAKVVVGVDGVLLKWLSRKRFIPMSDIVSVQPEGETRISVELTGGRRETIATAPPKRRGGVYTERRDVIVARIREAWQAHRSRGPGVDVATLVARGSRTLEEWKSALAGLAQGDAGYRQAAVREEDLWRVVEDPRASEDARAAAALVLRGGLDAPGKARVRVAAEATASPRLRVALEAATGEDEAAALGALDELEVKPLRAGASGGR